MANLAFKNVSGGPITRGVDLAIGDREFVVLAGPVNSGASSIVRVLAGLDAVSEGEILFDDKRLNDVAAKDRDVALMAHDYAAYPALSVFENLAIGLRRRSFAETEIRKRIDAVVAALGLEAQLQEDAASLSPEQRRFVGLARAMVRQPQIYLFDEPFAGLEPEAARRGRGEIVKLHQRSAATIIYATAKPVEAQAFGQRTVVLVNGAIEQEDLAQNIYDAPANLAVAKFFGDPPMNLVAGTLKQERGGLEFSESGDGTITVPLSPDLHPEAGQFAGKAVVLGFRAEALEISAPAEGRKPRGFRALVERAEVKGSETELYLQTGAHSLMAKSRGWKDGTEGGHRLEFELRGETVHLFDPETGRRITRQT